MTRATSPVTRRRFLGAVAAASAIGGLAGCAGIDPKGVPPRPEYGADPSALSPLLKYLVLSVHYQNLYFDNGGNDLPDRPTLEQDTSGFDRPLRFIVESMDYQNQYIEAEAN